jgi:hypothetical protein
MLRILVVATLLAGCASYKYSTFRKATAADYDPPSLLAQRQALREESRGERMAILADAPVVAASRARSSGLSLGGLFGGGSSATAAQAAQVVPAAVASKEKLVVEAWIRLQADDVAKAAAAVIARVEADGGRVVSSNLIGSDRAASSAAIELRVPPGKAAAFVTWTGSLGVIESRRTLASDVGKILFDQELELKNLELTMSRLQKLVEKDVPVKELLEIEKEMTRVRGDIERVKGEQRWLLDRVELATVTLTITREGGPIDPLPQARLYAGPRLSVLSLIDPAGRPRTRAGGGASVQVHRYFTLDLDLFPRKDGESRAALATLGSALYSSYLGGGRRRFGNPYLGFRVGYGYLSGEGCVAVGGELGVELMRHRYLLVEAAARAVAFFREEQTDGALHGLVGISVPF